ncbi:MAG: hypothetical protein V4549_07565 [Bacteroidota bacterium]
MSRSNPTADPILNPSKRWFQWDSTTKGFKYYDKDLPNPKDASKKGANVMVPIPFKFVVLDVLTTVGGFSDKAKGSFYGNEVRNFMGATKTEIMEVKLKGETVLKGSWDSIKQQAEAMDAKFANSIYIGYFDENKQMQLGNIKLFGSSIGAWIEVVNAVTKSGKKISDCAFKVATTNPGKKGAVEWNEPVFELITVKPETDAKAMELDTELQAFLKSYFSRTSTGAPIGEEAASEIAAAEAYANSTATETIEESAGVTMATSTVVEDEDF